MSEHTKSEVAEQPNQEKKIKKKWFNVIRKIINNIKFKNTKTLRKSEIEKIKPKKKMLK